MSLLRGRRSARGRVLSTVGGATMLIVVLSVLIVRSQGAGPVAMADSAPAVDLSALNTSALTAPTLTVPTRTVPTTAPGSTSTALPAVCSGIQQLINQCPTTTTTTTAPSSGSSSGGTDPSECAGGTSPPVAAPTGSWRCTFDDEFDGTSLDTSKWSAMTTFGSGYSTGLPGNQVCYENNPQTISESGGYLRLSIIKTTLPFACIGTNMYAFPTNIEGGEALSYQKFSQDYGYFEVRAAMPASTVPGLQETLWLWPDNDFLYGNQYPDNGEIDFGEFYSEYPNNDIPVVHYPGSANDPNATNDSCVLSGQSTAGQFHTYAVLWTPTTITTYYDGVACFADTFGPYVSSPDTPPEPFNQPFFLTLTAALGSTVGDEYTPLTPLPATTEVDWARVWQYGS